MCPHSGRSRPCTAASPPRRSNCWQPIFRTNAPSPSTAYNSFFGSLYPVFVRGQAYLAAGKGQEAAVEFQKLIDHVGLMMADPAGARARLEKARSLALAGDNVGARTAYEDFLSLWKDADADVPILAQAKAEYAKLQ